MPSSEISQAVQWFESAMPVSTSAGISAIDATRAIALSFIGVISADRSDQKLIGFS
jgi:hypothetical protein